MKLFGDHCPNSERIIRRATMIVAPTIRNAFEGDRYLHALKSVRIIGLAFARLQTVCIERNEAIFGFQNFNG